MKKTLVGAAEPEPQRQQIVPITTLTFGYWPDQSTTLPAGWWSNAAAQPVVTWPWREAAAPSSLPASQSS